MSRVIERDTGAQLLPPVGDVRAHATVWQAQLACDADVRTVNRVWRELAEELEVTA